MRLTEAYEVCKKAFINIEEYALNLAQEHTKIQDNDFDESNFDNMFERFYEYSKYVFHGIPYFDELLVDIERLAHEKEKEMHYKCLISNELYAKVKDLICLYETMINKNAESISLSIKIPETDNITELKRYIDGLEFVFTKCPFLQSDEESLKLQSVDNGSIWLIFGIVGASVAVGSVLLNNIAAFTDKCFVIRSHKLTCDMQKQAIENAQIEQKEKDELLKNINRIYKIFVENAIKELEASTGCKINDGDEMGRVEQSVEKTIKLLELGLQIHSSLNAPEEVKALFAPLEMHYLEIGKVLERIEEKGDKETE